MLSYTGWTHMCFSKHIVPISNKCSTRLDNHLTKTIKCMHFQYTQKWRIKHHETERRQKLSLKVKISPRQNQYCI